MALRNTDYDINKERTPEERRAAAIKAGKASGKARREKRDMKESLSILLDLAIKSGAVIDPKDKELLSEVKGKNLTVSDAILIAQIQKALKGDLRAAEFIRDTSGQKPIENRNVTQDLTVSNPFANLSTEELRKLIDDE